MSVKPRTVDNLGIDSSSRYAKDQATLDPKFLDDSRYIPLKTEVSVVKPYLPTEFELYLAPGKIVLWAAFEAPPTYLTFGKPIFSYDLIPSLGGYEKIEENTDKIEAMEDSLSKGFKDSKQNHQEFQEEEKKRKKVLALLKTIGRLDRSLSLINARRNQLQRG